MRVRSANEPPGSPGVLLLTIVRPAHPAPADASFTPGARAILAFVGALTGRVHGSTIDLDVTPSAPFEGKRVRVVLELVDEDLRLTAEQQASAWATWVANGPDGPIEDDGEPEIP